MDLETDLQSTQPELENAYQLTFDQVAARLNVDQRYGLGKHASSERLSTYGPNEIHETGSRGRWAILAAQLKSSLIALLVVAVVVSLLLGETTDALAIVAIIVLNTILGFWQDAKAEKALAELKKLSVAEVLVRRDGKVTSISSTQLVPGDIVLLQAGYLVLADCRLAEAEELEIDESALTGESISIAKTVDALPGNQLPLGDRVNCAYSGTVVVRGRGIGIVTATGMSTELGQIADSIQQVESEPTPLQMKLGRLGRSLALLAIAVVAFVFVVGLIGGQPPKVMLMTALSMAVALVPEGLPAVATVTLAIGANQMFRRQALIRQLPAVETLGSVSVICSDKTGTLTQNKMTVTQVDIADRCLSTGDNPVLSVESQPEAFQLMLIGCALCNDASVSQPGEAAVGEPTETALLELAQRYGWQQACLLEVLPRLAAIPFDSKRKRMSTIHQLKPEASESDQLAVVRSLVQRSGSNADDARILFTKGAVEVLADRCTQFWSVDGPQPLDQSVIDRIHEAQNSMASSGTRVLALACRVLPAADLSQGPSEDAEQQLCFVGLLGLSDPPRPEVKSAVSRCQQAGIRPIMITGDHPLTAKSIADDLGIDVTHGAMTGSELSQLTDEQLFAAVEKTSVFARVAPRDKLRIVEALQRHDQVVAMTGDGVNDAPALKQASVGVAMGINGTDVSKQAANVVLLDDNFATIVAAVEQGRNVFDNIRKYIKYTMSSNVGEVLVMAVGVLLGLPLPLLPLQILWINLMTDGLPGLALAFEPTEAGTMKRKPFPLNEPILSMPMRWDLLWIGGWICVVSLSIAWLLWNPQLGEVHWRTLVFTILTTSQLANAIACRSGNSIFNRRGTTSNRWLGLAVAVTFGLQMLVIYWSPLQAIFHTTRLGFGELVGCIVASLWVGLMVELKKLVWR